MQKTELRLAGVIRESIVDGPGIRMTVFVQGCPHHCKGCHNPQSWDFDGGYIGSVEKILEEAKKDPLLQGLTFSGGEPFCQAEPLAKLGRLAHENGYNIMTYTGYTFEQLVAGFEQNPQWKELLEQTDYLVDGPFILEKKSLLLHFRGSENQRILDVKKSLEQNKAVIAENI